MWKWQVYGLGLQGGREGSMHFMMTFLYIAYLFCKNNLDKNLSIYIHIYKVILRLSVCNWCKMLRQLSAMLIRSWVVLVGVCAFFVSQIQNYNLTWTASTICTSKYFFTIHIIHEWQVNTRGSEGEHFHCLNNSIFSAFNGNRLRPWQTD